jgi:hypothetical protein
MNHTEFLKYTFSEPELKDFSKELARENTTVAEAEEQKKAVVAQFTEKITSSKSKISQLSRYINNGYDYRNVECSIAMNSPNTGFKTVVRDDTGEEVKTLPMTESEMQEKLQFES